MYTACKRMGGQPPPPDAEEMRDEPVQVSLGPRVHGFTRHSPGRKEKRGGATSHDCRAFHSKNHLTDYEEASFE